jgi:hypothetical protein
LRPDFLRADANRRADFGVPSKGRRRRAPQAGTAKPKIVTQNGVTYALQADGSYKPVAGALSAKASAAPADIPGPGR